ncbi:hypothetical protein PLICRDRAFT_106074 [Plicaturopsis crispa FD-325 SS-3]|nr:hypothetical protein PLICRDRAFT_106074 [Plicaturopsis crispa FD-325 SS-3]
MSSASQLPTAEDKARYEAIKKDLMQALPKKRAIDKQLAQLEVQIYNIEGQYLTDTAAHSSGNIIQGFDNYLKASTVGRRRYEVHDADRLFSNSSASHARSLELVAEGEESSVPPADDHNHGVTTVIVPAATPRQEVSAAQQKKNRDREYQRKKRAGTGRGRSGTISDDESVTSSRRPTKRSRLTDD